MNKWSLILIDYSMYLGRHQIRIRYFPCVNASGLSVYTSCFCFSPDTAIKQNLNSLVFLRDTCNMRLKRLQEGTPDLETEVCISVSDCRYSKVILLL